MTAHHISHRLLLAAAAQDRHNLEKSRSSAHGRYLADRREKAITIALEVLQAGSVLRSDIARPLRLASAVRPV